MANVLTFDILGRDRASGALHKVGDAADKTGRRFSTFKTLAAGAAVAVGAALFKLGKDSVRQFAEAEKAQTQLTDAFARFPKLADISIDALRGYNKELALKTRFDDDALASGQALLAQFGLTGQELKKLTPLVADYAAKTGRDFPEAAKVLGKASLGNTRALKELGISYKVTGDQATDFAAITELVRAKVGGFAEREGKTAAGQLAILQNQFGELEEEIGAKLLPILIELAGGASKLLSAFSNLDPTVQKIVLGVGALSAGMLILVPRIAATTAALKTMGITSLITATRLGLISAAVAEVMLASDNLKNSLKILGDEQRSLGAKVGDYLKEQLKEETFGLIDLTSKSKEAKGSLNDLYSMGLTVAEGLIAKTNPALLDLGDAAKDAARKVDFLHDKMATTTETDIAFRDAVADWTAEVRDATKSGDKYAHSLSKQNQTGRDNVSALVDMAQLASAHGQAVLDQTHSVDKANDAVRAERKALLDAAEAAGFNRRKVADLIDQYLKVPKNVRTSVTATVSGLSQLQTLSNIITTINGVRVNIPVSALTARDRGGPVQAGRAYVVGERQAELFVPNQSGWIQPRVNLMRVAGRASGSSAAAPVNEENLARLIGKEVGRYLAGGMNVYMDGRMVGRAEARLAGLLVRGG